MRKAKNDHRYRVAIRAAVVALALGCLSLTAGAAGSRSEFDAFMDLATGSSKHTVGFGNGGVPITTRGVPGSTAAGNMNFSHTPGGMPNLGGQADVPSPLSGKKVPLNIKQPLTAAQTAGALGRFAKKALPVMGTGIALYDLAKELGFRAYNDPAEGDIDFEREIPGACSDGSPCYEYRVSPGDWSYSRTGACNAYIAIPGSQGGPSSTGSGTYYTLFHSVTDTGGNGYGVCKWSVMQTSTGQGVTVNQASFDRRVGQPTAPTYESASWEEFVAAIASKSGWPDGSAVDRALADAANAGGYLEPMTQPAVATSAGVAKVDAAPYNTIKSDGTTVTSQESCDWISVTGGIEWRCGTTTTTSTPEKTTTETVVKTNPDGSTVTEVVTRTTPAGTTTESTTGEPESRSDCDDGSGGTRVGCAELDTPEGEIPKSTKTITYSEENVFGSGSCPGDVTASIGTLGRTVKVWDWQKTCAMAMPLRALVLSLATFAAFLILMPGRVAT